MSISTCSVLLKPLRRSSAVEVTKTSCERTGFSSFEARKRQDIIFHLTRLIVPPLHVNCVKAGNLYIRKRAGRKEFVVKTQSVDCDLVDMDSVQQQVEREIEKLLKKKKALLEEKRTRIAEQECAEQIIEEKAARLVAELEKDCGDLCRKCRQRDEESSIGSRERPRPTVRFVMPEATHAPGSASTSTGHVRRGCEMCYAADNSNDDDSSDSDCSLGVTYNGHTLTRRRKVSTSDRSCSPPQSPQPEYSCDACSKNKEICYHHHRRHRRHHRGSTLKFEQRRYREEHTSERRFVRVETRHPSDYR